MQCYYNIPRWKVQMTLDITDASMTQQWQIMSQSDSRDKYELDNIWTF